MSDRELPMTDERIRKLWAEFKSGEPARCRSCRKLWAVEELVAAPGFKAHSLQADSEMGEHVGWCLTCGARCYRI